MGKISLNISEVEIAVSPRNEKLVAISVESGINKDFIYNTISQINPDPIVFVAQTDITSYTIPNTSIRKALVYADGRLLVNTSISDDTVHFNETIYKYQQVFIDYQKNI